MSEEQNQEEDKQKEPTKTEDSGSQYETTPVIERAREEREKLEAANTKKEELLNREEAIMAKRALGGDSEAGQETTKKEESPKEYNERIEKEINEGKHDE